MNKVQGLFGTLKVHKESFVCSALAKASQGEQLLRPQMCHEI